MLAMPNAMVSIAICSIWAARPGVGQTTHTSATSTNTHTAAADTPSKNPLRGVLRFMVQAIEKSISSSSYRRSKEKGMRTERENPGFAVVRPLPKPMMTVRPGVTRQEVFRLMDAETESPDFVFSRPSLASQ